LDTKNGKGGMQRKVVDEEVTGIMFMLKIYGLVPVVEDLGSSEIS
jgi:hypothetical protein